MNIRNWLTLAILLAASMHVAAATGLTASHKADTLTKHCCWDNSFNYDEDTGIGTVEANSWTATARAAGTPGFGVLTGAVSASASRFGGYASAGGSGRIRDYWVDQFTVTSASLLTGTPVLVKVAIELDYSAMAQRVDGGTTNIQAIAALHFNGPDAPWITGVTYDDGGQVPAGTTGGVLRNEATFASTVGATLHLVGDLYLYAGANASLNPSSASASLEGTARYTVSVLTPDAAMSSLSGAPYVTPVPEPEAVAMWLAGLLGMGMLVRRRRLADAG